VGSIAIAGGVAIAIVLVTRGSFRQLLRLRIQSIWLAILALGIQIALEFVDVPKDRIDDLGFALLMGSYALLLAFCFVNLRVRAMWIVALGVALNTLVIGLNQGMPTRDRDVTTASGRTVDKPIERTAKHRPESDDDLLPFLGDQIVIPDPVDEVISAGDIVLAFGIVAVCYSGSHRRRLAPSRRSTRRSARTAAAARRLRERAEQRHREPPLPGLVLPRLSIEGLALPPEPDDEVPSGAELAPGYVQLSMDDRREHTADAVADTVQRGDRSDREES
jgi:hypothetical protein